MLFNSFEFLLFFPIVTIIYFLLPGRLRWLHLLIASCIFYMYFIPVYILILFFTIVVDYFAGILIENAEGHRKKTYLSVSLIANIGVLAVFKYYNFINDNITQLLGVSGIRNPIPILRIALPIGLSFHTFQAMSYNMEVYRGNQKAERHFGIYALYVMFYPQLVAGPIERPQNLLHQFHENKRFEYHNVVAGLRQIMWGLVKKLVVADRLANVADPIIGNPHGSSGISLAIGMVCFAFQIYADFSGYSDIALGCARVMGFKLMVNFNFPFRSKSVSEFWRRWHISLSTWLGDYVFTPLAIKYRNLGLIGISIASMITFLISGLWHGSAWNYVIWGALHGLAISCEMLSANFLGRVRDTLRLGFLPVWFRNFMCRSYTFVFLIVAWVYFRANTFSDANFILSKIPHVFSELTTIVTTHKLAFLHLPSTYTLLGAFSAILFLEIAQYLYTKLDLTNNFDKVPKIGRWAIYYAGILVIYNLGIFENHSFIYFQF